MLATFFGLLLLLTPFILIFYFKNRILGFLYIFVGLTTLHLFLALLAQYFHFFSYSFVLTINIIIALFSLIFFFFNRSQFNFRFKFNWMILVAALVIIFELFSVHYLYSGLSTDNIGHKNVSYRSYPYPYFSDEWAGVAFTKYTIASKSLPIINPLWGNEQYGFPNIFVAFFSGLSELFLSLNLVPLTGYPIITILTGFLVCLFIFLFLKSIKVDTFFALLAALSLPWIINSVNLPGIWYLFPFIAGTIFLLAGLTALNFNYELLALLSGFLSLLFYPPFVVFIVPIIIVYLFLGSKFSLKKFFIFIASLVGLLLLAMLFIFLTQLINWRELSNLFVNSLLRNNYEGCIPSRPLWFVIPVYLLPFALLGIWSAIKKKLFYFLAPLFIGLLYWAVYAYYPRFFIIDYARIAAITSYLLMISVGLGAEFSWIWLSKKYHFLRKPEVILALKISILVIFTFFSFFYTQQTGWTKIVLRYNTAVGIWERPMNPPVNEYLQADDLRLFSGLKKQVFFAPLWKALVIGAATGNYPVESKASIITNFQASYNIFMFDVTNCSVRAKMAEKIGLDYVYSPPFNCDRFEYVDKSREGLYLYKFQK